MRYFALMNSENLCINILGTLNDTVAFARKEGEWDTEISKEIFEANPIGLYFKMGIFAPKELNAPQEILAIEGGPDGNVT